MDTREHISITATIAGWIGWLVSHVAEINNVLQMILLVTSIIATVLAARYHWRMTRAKDNQPK